MATSTPLDRLQKWYHAQCNGEWEHSYGVTIGTLDNPGWTFDVDLADTPLAAKSFAKVERGLQGDGDDWLACFVRDHKFMGRCSPERLGEAIEVFLSWAVA
jgi:hypothetical protein